MARSKTAPIDIPSYRSAQELVEAEAGKMFLELENKSFSDVGYLFGLDRFFNNQASIRSAVTRAYNIVLNHPERYGVLPEKVAFIHGMVKSRAIQRTNPETIREAAEMEKLDIVGAITKTRDQAIRLLKRKLDYLEKNPRAFKEEKLKDLGWITGLLFDKGQIASGMATEHIAVMSNIPDKLEPEEALKAIMVMREQQIVENTR